MCLASGVFCGSDWVAVWFSLPVGIHWQSGWLMAGMESLVPKVTSLCVGSQPDVKVKS